MLIENATVVLRDREVEGYSVLLQGGRISGIGPSERLRDKTTDERIYAWCPVCKSDGVAISNWHDTLWADGPMEPVRVDEERSVLH